MTNDPRIITDHKQLRTDFHNLQRGDIICSRIPLRRGEEHILCDLVDRGIHLIPSATAQLASRSKTLQARIFSQWMIPHTYSVYDRHQLLEIVHLYHQKSIEKVILKQDGKNAGIGILLFGNIEEIYNQAANNLLAYPFVTQPFIADCTDLRVIVLGDYREAYTRLNPNGFRNNLHCGGTPEPYTITPEISKLCENIMQRGNFPYGYLDFMLTEMGEIFLAEINLRGGLRGATISSREHTQRAAVIERKLAEKIQSTDGCPTQ